MSSITRAFDLGGLLSALASVAPSSPASRPSPAGGLTATLDPDCGQGRIGISREHVDFKIKSEIGGNVVEGFVMG
jgi:hypothetical protein